jgi:hypothetical protein
MIFYAILKEKKSRIPCRIGDTRTYFFKNGHLSRYYQDARLRAGL